MFRYFLFLLLLFSFPALGTAQECIVAVPTGSPLDVRDNDGNVVSTLQNGQEVQVSSYSDSKNNQLVFISGFRGDYIGYVFSGHLQCRNYPVDPTYPLILSYDDLKEFGLDYTMARDSGEPCFYIGDGVISLRVFGEQKAKIGASKTRFDAFCFVARSDGLKFDPETGRRLATFVIKENLPEFAFEYPLEIPRCFRSATVKISDLATLAFAEDCRLRFNPCTGRRINPADKAILIDLGLFLDGAAGPAPSEASVASIRGKGAVSQREIAALKKKLGM